MSRLDTQGERMVPAWVEGGYETEREHKAYLDGALAGVVMGLWIALLVYAYALMLT
ncbi:hypothetical protein LCGC14_0313190 [marine sediment metagenome]|uniref:Uncharacterized protein n=1 Tax=marine sediment metagenome TaxID=412755 RepID=A0A0F9U415_9ZZZZ